MICQKRYFKQFHIFCWNSSITVYAEETVDYDSIDSELKDEVEKFHIPGMAVLIVDKDEILFRGTYGNCKEIDTPFIIGSVSKSFTALAVMQLVEAGKIELDEPISSYLNCTDYFKNGAEGEKITVKQLLNQTGGLGTYQRFGNAKITDMYGKHLYSNVNYGLLGEIIEAVSGESYADYMDKHIFIPLQMEHSAATLEKSIDNGLIDGYRNYFGFSIPGAPDYPDSSSWSTVPAGYLSASASDMGKYLQMYLNGGRDIISQDSIHEMFYDNVYVEGENPSYYGMGWILTNQYSEPILTHSGLVENYMSNMFLLPDRDIGIVFLINTNDYLVTNPLANSISDNVIQTILGGDPYEVSGSSYITYHLILDIIYSLIIVVAVLSLVKIKRWKNKKKTKFTFIIDVIRHFLLPSLLLGLPYILGVPMWVIWYYVKDLCCVLIGSTAILLCVGLYKVFWILWSHKKSFSN